VRQTALQHDEITLRSRLRSRAGEGLASSCHPVSNWSSMLVSVTFPHIRLRIANTPYRTKTRTQLGIDATITNYPEFLSSMDQHWSTSGVLFSGTERVIVYTSLETFPGGSFTGYYTYDIHALRSAGYTITTSTQEIVSCSPTATSSATGECEPHGDHWHCPPGVAEPTTPPSSEPHTTRSAPSTGEYECEPHGDHWHCPPGVAEPTTPPAPSSTPIPTTPTSDECEAHGDHWHCPDGVPEPTTPPSIVTPTPTSLSSVTASASFTRTASDAPVFTAGVDAKTTIGKNFLVLAAAVPFVFGMI
ncbi:hypothetical protein QBC41DRAFT_229212, partial [Cercophora samala]